MRTLMTPTLRVSLGLLSITMSLVFVACSFGLLPTEHKAALEARARISENLAIQLAGLASRNDEAAIKDTIGAVLARNSDVLSIAIRGPDEKLLVDSGTHQTLWREPEDGKSTDSFVQVPLLDGDVPKGKIEFVFRPLAEAPTALHVPREILGFMAFIGVAGFIGYYLILSRVLRELDPGRAIPERVKAAFDTLAEGVLILDDSARIVLVNDAFEQNVHGKSDSLIGSDADELPWVLEGPAAPDTPLPWQTAMRDAKPVLGVPASIHSRVEGELHLIINATPITEGGGVVRGAIVTFDDVSALHHTNEQLNSSINELHLSQIKIAEQNRQLQILASCDPLTGCLNRRTFFAEAELMLRDALRLRQPMSFLMLDADHFKSVNDRFGHAVGDAVLVGLVGVMKRVCGQRGLIGRYGGEEFCIAVVGLSEQDIEGLAERLRIAVSDADTWLPNGERVTVSIGIASIGFGCQMADLVKRADSALYTAKATGRNRYVNWRDLPSSTGLSEKLRIAVRDRKLHCEFQPKVDIGNQRVVGFETLVRWHEDRGETHSPAELVRLAIEAGLIGEITRFVLHTAIRSVGALDAAFGAQTTISVNVSAKLANDLDFMLQFSQVIRDSGIADRIILELTEESFITKGNFQSTIVPLLHEAGVRISIDDFGTGYSSLSALADIMADEIKIDRSFVSGIHERPRSQSILRAINSLARSLNMNIVAEGVEKFEELAYLQAATSIRQVQGFYFSKPFRLEDINSAKNLFAPGLRHNPVDAGRVLPARDASPTRAQI